MLKGFARRRETRRIAAALYARLSAQSRNPVFYAAHRVSDSFDGRFDLLVFHAWMVLEALRNQGQRELAQFLVDALFLRLDEALREQGASDMGMKRRMKKMAGAFYGRLHAYGEARDESALAAALVRNLYRGEAARIEQATLLAKYAGVAGTCLAQSPLAKGEADFGPVPAANGDRA
ncbi:MAG TPA: ubiquinol-cytochrome C chaperone family protein [Rhizomicrobium sp.]|nr:ubiquinol-cytochrome C chaperone family protein [Rhizomicrobium sp.]